MTLTLFLLQAAFLVEKSVTALANPNSAAKKVPDAVNMIIGIYPYAHCSLLQVVLEWVLGYLNTF